jgi:uncharacterized membrane protein
VAHQARQILAEIDPALVAHREVLLQEARDRLRAEHDYQVNLKAELEIRHLHQKIDHLLSRQWERLVEIQEVQMELINQVSRRKG